MTPLARELARICRELPPTVEKVLLCPSRRIGHQWIEAVAFSGQAATNVRPTTVRALALELAGPEMVEKGLELLTPRGSNLVLSKILEGAVSVAGSGKVTGYFTRLLAHGHEGPGLSSSVLVGSLASCFFDLRMAGVAPGDLERGQYVAPGKGEEVIALYRAWVGKLAEHRLIDHADALRMARLNPILATGRAFYIIPEGMDLTSAERAFIAALPTERCRALPAGRTDLPAAVSGKEVELFSAVGEVNEVREAFRRVLDRRSSLDQVELLYTRDDPYLSVIFEEACRLFLRDGEGLTDVPVTFEEGIPVRYSRPGRALAGWLAWARGGFPQSVLVRMIQDGLLKVPSKGEGVSFLSLANALRRLPIGFGKERYIGCLEQERAALDRRLAASGGQADEDGEVDEGAKVRLDAALWSLGLLSGIIAPLVEATPGPEGWGKEPDAVLLSARRFLEDLASASGEFDEFARRFLLDEIAEIERWTKLLGTIPSEEVLDFLQSLARESRVAGSGPRPGRLHVTPIERGGHSGRALTFVLGLDDSRFPGPSSPDPILLDGERKTVSEGLPLSAAKARVKRDDFARLIGRLDGMVVLSYSERDLSEDGVMFPSPVLLPLYREVKGLPEASMEDLEEDLGRDPASFAPADRSRSLDEGEWWMSVLCGQTPLAAAEDAVGKRFPWLARGREAEEQRARVDAVGPFDGLLTDPGEELDPSSPAGPVLSPSALEAMGACPFRYFLSRVLGAEPPEEMIEKERDAWLDPLQFGNLLHEVLADFVEEAQGAGAAPGRERLEAIVRKKAAEYRELYPPPDGQSFDDQLGELLRAAGNFFVEEVPGFAAARPVAVELAVGMRGSSDPDPVPVVLPGGRTMRVRGKIDRVDLVKERGGRSSLRITDYKSGSGWGYDVKPFDPKWAGRKMQPFVYRELARASSALRELASGAASRVSFRYYFPASRSHSAPVEWSPDEMDAAGDSLDRLCRLMAQGAFPATTNEDDCTYCDFKGVVCQKVEVQAQRMTEKAASADERLEPFRELRAAELPEKGEGPSDG